MSFGWDLFVAFLCGWMAMLCFGVYAVTSPKRTIWRTWPPYVRRGFLLAGVMLTWRSANLATLSIEPMGPGKVNGEAVLTSIALAYLFTALAVYVAREQLPANWWERLRWVQGQARQHPELVPVMASMQEISGLAQARGATGLPPFAGGEDLLRALERSSSQAEH